MRLSSSTRRNAALLAASTIGLSTALLTVTGVASATAAPITSADDYSVSSSDTGNPTSVTINNGFCTAYIDVIGGEGGANTGGTTGPADEVSATIPVQAGQIFSFHLGGAATGDTAGTNPDDATADGLAPGTAGTGAGGAGSSLALNGGGVVASAKGGTGGSTGGGAGGGTTQFDAAHYTLDNGATNPFLGSTADPSRGSNWTGGGEVGVNVMACDAPYSPNIHSVTAQDTSAVVDFYPDQGDQTTAAPTGYEYTLDGGTTWTAVTTQQLDPTATSPTAERTFTLSGLTTGHAYSVQMRATSQYNGTSQASSASDFTPTHTVAAPANLKATVGPSSITITWDAPAGETGITGYSAQVIPGARPQSSQGMVQCPAMDASARSCTLTVPAGTVYSVGVNALNPAPGLGAFLVSDSVPAPSAPASVPTGSGTLQSGTAAVAASLTAGQKVPLSGSGYAPNSTVSLFVYSTPTLLATVTTDATGSFSTYVTVPSDLAPGGHHLVAAGLDPSGAMRYLRSDVTVAVPANQLAWTGFETMPYVVAGVLAVAAGVGMVLISRRRRTA